MDNLHNIVDSFSSASDLMQKNLPLVLGLMGGLYLLHLLNFLLRYRLNIFGILPRHPWGLLGILFSPFLHANFNHLFFNSIPLIVLVSFIMLYGFDTFVCVSAIIIILGGLGTWLFGRKGIHVGASGLIMGYWSYLLVNAYQQGTALSIALASVCLYYFGGLIFNLFPMEVKSSWEAHIFGFVAGLIAAFVWPDLLALLNANGYMINPSPLLSLIENLEPIKAIAEHLV